MKMRKSVKMSMKMRKTVKMRESANFQKITLICILWFYINSMVSVARLSD